MLVTFTWIDLGIVVAAALFTALILLMATSKIQRGNVGQQERAALPVAGQTLSFDFDLSGQLLFTNEAGATLLDELEIPDPDWAQFRAMFLDRFPDLPGGIVASDKPRLSTHMPCSCADPMELELEQHASGLSINLRNRGFDALRHSANLHRTLASLPNLDLIRTVCEQAPFPIWQSFSDGSIGWSNGRYQSLDTHVVRQNGVKGRPLFILPDSLADAGKPVRVSLKDIEHNRTYWFDVSREKFETGHLNFAVDIHAVVNAESAQRNFVQTLAKTFAHLAIGLAIFDRNRQLVLFNPSLIDLTELRPDYLTARPNLFSFFDQLRDNHVMPEPKNYASWRERIADVISAACDDNFNETWHLPNGLTYRVTGRPHPDGAIAFLFEDISAEISLTRRFRGEADITRSALDALEDSLAIFNQAGFLQLSNRAMGRFFDPRKPSPLEKMNIREVTCLWQEQFQPSPAWGEIRDFITGNAERETWSTQLRHVDGHRFDLQVSPLVSGATLVTFRYALAKQGKGLQTTSKSKRSSTVAA